MRTPRIFALAALLALSSHSAIAGSAPADPLNSVMWQDMASRFLKDGEIVFDQRVKVMAPASAEDQFFVPVTVDASGLGPVSEIVILADLNPIPHVLTYRPVNAEAFIAFRLKLEQASAIRAAVRTLDGKWHVGGQLVDAAGGGCTAPAMAHGLSNWMATLGETHVGLSREPGGQPRVTLRMRHPMDTGLADGIPAFYMSSLDLNDAQGQVYSSLEIFEPVSENPTFTFKPRAGRDKTTLAVAARDTEGNNYTYQFDMPGEGVAN